VKPNARFEESRTACPVRSCSCARVTDREPTYL
jgi:hypothetical protein